MSKSNPWSRIKEGRLFQVLLAYLAVSWILLQIVDMFIDNLGLPAWVFITTLVLLVIGLAVILTTAWVQASPLTARLERTDRVPGSWELAPSEIIDALSRGTVPFPTWPRALMGGVVAFSLLFGAAGLYVLLSARDTTPPDFLVSNDADPGIAVLPFEVSGDDLGEWREGMVSLLSTNLDGVGGLRAIDSRTVLARWDQMVAEDERADLRTALQVGRASGARHAVVGRAVAAGAGVRLSADVYDLTSGQVVGDAQVEGPGDDVFSLVDRLSIDVVRAVLPDLGSDAIRVDLARLTTSSLPALQAYLDGETEFRRGRFEEAIPHYERAVQEDSTFALALYRLTDAYGWTTALGSSQAVAAADRAARQADRLPEREALVFRATRALERGVLDELDPLQQASRRYPDDPEIWFQLGELYYHYGDQALVDTWQGDEYFARVLELDPGNAPALIHRIDLAFRFEPDSARIRALTNRYVELAPETNQGLEARLAFDLTFGDSATRAAALAALDTASVNLISLVIEPLLAPQSLAVAAQVLEVAGSPALPGWYNRLVRGQFAESWEFLPETPGWFVPLGYLTMQSRWERLLPGSPVPEQLALLADTLEVDRNRVEHLLFAGVRAIESDDRAGLASHLADLDSLRLRELSEADTVGARVAGGLGVGLQGYAAWQAGDLAGARELIAEAQRTVTGSSPTSRLTANLLFIWWLGQLELEAGRPEEALRYFSALYFHPTAALEAGQIYEKLGRIDEALEAYRHFVTAWVDADPEFQPLVEEVGQRIARLMDAPRTESQ
jgi:tetratricopeptide (TPR) repeat protein